MIHSIQYYNTDYNCIVNLSIFKCKTYELPIILFIQYNYNIKY